MSDSLPTGYTLVLVVLLVSVEPHLVFFLHPEIVIPLSEPKVCWGRMPFDAIGILATKMVKALFSHLTCDWLIDEHAK